MTDSVNTQARIVAEPSSSYGEERDGRESAGSFVREIVHITADFPDQYVPKKTVAVRSLIELTPEFRHRVYSLNRVNGLRGATSVASDDRVTALVYRGLPYGALMRVGLRPVSEWILADLQRRQIQPDCIHTNKLTIDGLVAFPVARALGCPLICGVWGDTDLKVIQGKPELRAAFRAVAEHASHILPCAPWAADFVEKTLGVPKAKMTLLPLISRVDKPIASAPSQARVATVFHLDSHRRKNVARLISAIGRLRERGVHVGLDIFGGGSAEAIRAVTRLIEKSNLSDRVRLMGPLDHSVVQSEISRYAAFALPSLRETFGMVFVEALFAGVPILYPQNAALDGFFTDVTVGYRCRPRDVEDIANGLEVLLRYEAELKGRIAELHEQGFFRNFEDKEIAALFSRVVSGVCDQSGTALATRESH
jgi:glycogen synthase